MRPNTYDLLKTIYDLRLSQGDGDNPEGDDVNNLGEELDAKLMASARKSDDIAVYQKDDEYILVGDVHEPWVIRVHRRDVIFPCDVGHAFCTSGFSFFRGPTPRC